MTFLKHRFGVIINMLAGTLMSLEGILGVRQEVIVSILLLLFSILSDDRPKASSKTNPPHSAIQSLLFQMRVSSPVLKVIHNSLVIVL